MIPDQNAVQTLLERNDHPDEQSSQIVLSEDSRNQAEDEDSDLWGTMPTTWENNPDSSSDRFIEHH